MAERPESIVGIDLGTTYSVVAALDPAGRPVTIPNRHGELSTPSVLLFEDDRVIVGKEAQRLALLEPDRVAECAKRDMGARHYHRPVAGRQVPPQVISATVLKRLKADAERRVGPIRRVVVTVPAYFDHTRREATCQAAHLARLEVADLLNEPTAAALAYGFQEGFLDQGGALDGRKTARKGVLTVVVYDLGGGTFDVTVLQIRDRQFKTLVTDGDVRLGGRDWDRRIVDHAAAGYMAEHPKDDPRDDPLTLQSLFQQAEEAKRTLSERSKTRLVYAHRGHRVTLELSRAEFFVRDRGGPWLAGPPGLSSDSGAGTGLPAMKETAGQRTSGQKDQPQVLKAGSPEAVLANKGLRKTLSSIGHSPISLRTRCDDPRDVGPVGVLEDGRERHRHVGRGDADDRGEQALAAVAPSARRRSRRSTPPVFGPSSTIDDPARLRGPIRRSSRSRSARGCGRR